MEAWYLVGKGDGDAAALAEAKRLLRYATAYAPAERVDAMLEGVPLHRAIREA